MNSTRRDDYGDANSNAGGGGAGGPPGGEYDAGSSIDLWIGESDGSRDAKKRAKMDGGEGSTRFNRRGGGDGGGVTGQSRIDAYASSKYGRETEG